MSDQVHRLVYERNQALQEIERLKRCRKRDLAYSQSEIERLTAERNEAIKAGANEVSCRIELQARVEELEADVAECSNPYGDYYFGLRCGLEDRDITDRYEAAEYGWDQAFEYVDSILAATEQGESE